MASQRRKRRSPTTAAPVAGHSSRYFENRRSRFQAPADSTPTRAQYDVGSARSASALLPTASLGCGVARKHQAAHPLTRRIFLRLKEVKLVSTARRCETGESLRPLANRKSRRNSKPGARLAFAWPDTNRGSP